MNINNTTSKQLSNNQINASRNFFCLIICIFLFCTGFIIHGNIGLYFNFSGLIIVIGGTFGAILISYRIERIRLASKVLNGSYQNKIKTSEEIIEILVDLSVKSKIRGLLSLQEDEEETSVLYLRQALGLLVDDYPLASIRDILETETYFFKLRREDSEQVFRTMGEICPCFGLVGSVVGLIGMLAGVDDTSVILATVPIALTSTLYGVIFSNFLFLPFATNIREKTEQEILLQKIISEGIIAIGSNYHPRILETKLKSFLTPSSRTGRLVSLKRIKEKFNITSKSDEFDSSDHKQGVAFNYNTDNADASAEVSGSEHTAQRAIGQNTTKSKNQFLNTVS